MECEPQKTESASSRRQVITPKNTSLTTEIEANKHKIRRTAIRIHSQSTSKLTVIIKLITKAAMNLSAYIITASLQSQASSSMAEKTTTKSQRATEEKFKSKDSAAEESEPHQKIKAAFSGSS